MQIQTYTITSSTNVTRTHKIIPMHLSILSNRNKLWTGKDLQGSCHGKINVLLRKDSLYTGRYSNQAPSEFKSTSLALDQPLLSDVS
jgi:hypothetical protein